MKKVPMLGLMGLFVVSLLAIGAFAMPFGNSQVKDALENNDYTSWKESMSSELTEERFNKMSERHQAMQEKRLEMEQAISEGYGPWAELMEDWPVTEKVTEENFNTFVQMYEARQSGDFETAQELAEELGLEKRGKGFGKMHRGFGGDRPMEN